MSPAMSLSPAAASRALAAVKSNGLFWAIEILESNRCDRKKQYLHSPWLRSVKNTAKKDYVHGNGDFLTSSAFGLKFLLHSQGGISDYMTVELGRRWLIASQWRWRRSQATCLQDVWSWCAQFLRGLYVQKAEKAIFLPEDKAENALCFFRSHKVLELFNPLLWICRPLALDQPAVVVPWMGHRKLDVDN